MKNKSEKTTKRGLKCPQTNQKLTNAETEVLGLITEEFLTLKQITIRRQCSPQAVYKILKKLREKGALSYGLKKVENFQSSKQPNKRLHGEEWNIGILYQDHYYQNKLKKANTRFIDGHTIRLYRNSIEIYAGEGTSFWGETEQRATAISLMYWQKFFHKLENELKVILIKPRAENIKKVCHHYGNIRSDFVKNCEEKGNRIRIYAKEDGKLWFDMDQSFKFKEREHPHPETAKQDSELISYHMNDLRDNNPPTNSQLAGHIGNLVKISGNNQQMLAGLPPMINKLEQQIASHLKLIQEYRKENIKWRRQKEKEIKKTNEDQTRLDNFK